MRAFDSVECIWKGDKMNYDIIFLKGCSILIWSFAVGWLCSNAIISNKRIILNVVKGKQRWIINIY